MERRIATLKTFDEVFRRGRNVFCGSVQVRILPAASEELRWGVAVSAKKWKRAVDRNRIKRVLREAVRPLLGHFRNGGQVVFLFLGDNPGISPETLREDIEQGLRKANIL